MAEHVRLKLRTFALIVLATAAMLPADVAPMAGDGLVEMWRHAFSPRKATTRVDAQGDAAQKALGATLFRDPRLSGGGGRACISCHKPELGMSDGRQRARPLAGSGVTLRNTPTLYNLAAATAFNWDGSAKSLEQQVVGPIQNPGELAASFDGIRARLSQDDTMRRAFAKAFPNTPQISQDTISRALASYVRSLTAPQTAFDAWVAGDDSALSKRQRAGFGLFVGKGGCVACHVGTRFSDDAFHDIGLPDDMAFEDPNVAGKRGVRAFKTPMLRAISKTAPYMHNGSLNTLSDVVNHYTSGIVQRRGLSGILPPKLDLSDNEKDALVSFLESL